MDSSDLAALLPQGYPKYKSKNESDWATFGSMILFAELQTATQWQGYEPVTFNIPGGRYKPDFMHVLADGRIAWVEVKGSKKQRGYRESRSKLRAAASIHPWFIWIEAIGEYMSWEIETL